MIRFDNLPPEVMQAMCTPMHLILPASPQQRTGALFLGSFSAILDPALLSSNNIAALVQVLDAPWLPSVEAHAQQGNKLECYRLDILDSTSADLRPHLEATVRWIDERLRRGINILVHCQQVRALLLSPQNASLTRPRASPSSSSSPSAPAASPARTRIPDLRACRARPQWSSRTSYTPTT